MRAEIVLYILIFLGLFMGVFYILTFLETRKKQEIKDNKIRDVTFVVPVHNKEDSLVGTVESIFNSDYPKEKIHVLIVNDESTDNSLAKAKYLEKKYKNVSVVSRKSDGIKAAAVNFGIKRVKTELIATLDADSLLKKDLLRKTVTYFANPTIQAVTCRQMPINDKLFLERLQKVEYTLVGFFRKMMSNISSLPIAANYTVYRREVFQDYGGFDVGNLTEDYEMGMRIQSHNKGIAYVVDSYAETYVPKNLKELDRQRLRWNYGALYNLNKYKHVLGAKYGDLGLFIMPATFLGMLSLVTTLCLAAQQIIVNSIILTRRLLIGWSPSMIPTDSFRLALYFTDPKILLILLALAVMIALFVITKRMTKEKISFLNYAIYIIVYNWIVAYFYVVSLTRYILKLTPKW